MLVVRRSLLEDAELRRRTLSVQRFDTRVAGRRGGDVLSEQQGDDTKVLHRNKYWPSDLIQKNDKDVGRFES